MLAGEKRPYRISELGEYAQQSGSVIARLMADKLARPEMLSLAAGFTDNRALPMTLVAEAVEGIRGRGDLSCLQYGTNRGRSGLRQVAVDLLKSYPGEAELPLTEDNVIITNGSQQGLYIMVQILCNPGDIVLVERPSYFVFLELLHGLGVRPVSIPCDAFGQLDVTRFKQLVEDLQQSGEWDRVKLMYLMGAFANPSSACLRESDKVELAGLLQSLERPVPVIEDMAYRELYFEEPYPAQSLLSLKEWTDYPVMYAGTFTKPFVTGMKVGFMASHDGEMLELIAKAKTHQDFGTSNFNQAILEHAFKKGVYPNHLKTIQAHYAEKCRLLEMALRENGFQASGWEWQSPKGGLLLWARGPEGTDTRLGSAFHARCLEKEILYVPGDLCFAEGEPHNYVRLSFGALESELIPEAARRFCAAVRGG